MWIANRKRREFTNVQTGTRISIGDANVVFWYSPTTEYCWHLGKVNGPDDVELIYKDIRDYFVMKNLLLLEFEE